MRSGRRCGAHVVMLCVVLALSACTGPARTSEDYKLKARSSAKAASSAVATAQLTATLVRERKAFANYVAVVLTSAERDASSVSSTFASIQPPNRRSDRLREQLGEVLDDAEQAISSMRIAARRHAWRDLLAASRELPGIQRRLQRYETL